MHTKGPWKVHVPNENDGRIMVLHPDNVRLIADTSIGYKYRGEIISDKERMDNARLIAAAPDLLEACKDLLQCLESHLDESCRDHNIKNRDLLCPCNQNEVKRAKLAITKAEGKE